MVDLDTRARDAAAGLRSAAGRRTRPAWEPPGPRRGDRPRVVLALAAVLTVVAVVAAAGVALGTRAGDEEVTPTQAGGVPTLVPDAVPDGLTALGAVDLPRASGTGSPERITLAVFGDPAAADPFAAAELGVSILYAEGAEPTGESQLTVRGHAGWTSVDPATGRRFVTWEEAPGVLVGISSATIAQADLLAVAEGLTFDDEHAHVDAPVLPPGLSLVGSLDDSAYTGALAPVMLPSATSGHLVGYHDAAGNRAVTVATLAAEPDELLAVRWGLGEPAGEVGVRGHAGQVRSQPSGSVDGDPLLAVVWEELPGVFCVVAGDVDQATLLAIAESLGPATDQEWADLLALGDRISPDP